MENINELLEKYWNAESSLDEEKALKQYFSQNEIAEEHKHLRPLFVLYKTEAQKVSKYVSNDLPKTEAKVVKFNNYLKGAAAALVLGFASLAVVQYMMPKQVKSTNLANKGAKIINIENPDEALEYTEDAIIALASVFKISKEEIEKGMKNIDEAPVIGQKNNNL